MKQIYPIDKNSKEYKKYASALPSSVIKCFLLGIPFLVFAYLLEVLKLDTNYSFILIFVYLAIVIITIMKGTVRSFQLLKIANSTIVKMDNDILILYGNTSSEILSSVSSEVMTGGVLANSNDTVVKAAGVGLSAIGSIKKIDEVNNKNYDLTNTIDIDINIENLLNSPVAQYDYYKDVTLSKTSNKYLFFEGEKMNKDGSLSHKKFKINKKLYYGIDGIIN